MPPAAWIAIGGFIATAGWAVMWWAFRRQIGRTDELERGMWSQDGCVRKLESEMRMELNRMAGRLRDEMDDFVTEESLQMNMRPIADQLARILTQGDLREERLTKAIGDNSRKTDEAITGIHQRIDRTYEQRNNGSAPRGG